MSVVYWIIEYIASTAEMLSCCIFSGSFIEVSGGRKYLKRMIITCSVMGAFVILINSIDLFSPATVVIFSVFYPLTAYLVYRRNIIKLICLTSFFFFIGYMFDSITVSVYSSLFDTRVSEFYEKMTLLRASAVIISKIPWLSFSIAFNKVYTKRGRNIPRKVMIFLFALTLFTAFVAYFFTFVYVKSDTVRASNMTFLYIIILVLLITILLGVCKISEYYESIQQLSLTKLKNEMLEQSMSETEHTFMLWKNSLHNYKHNIMNLMTLANSSDMQGIKDYLEKENDLLCKTLFYYKTGNDTVDTILNVKQKYAEEKGIAFIINAEVPGDCRVSSFDFSSILGNLIDNAIEASEKETDPYIEVKIKSSESFLIIVILNKCTRSDIDLKTTKSDKNMHGIGISSVKYTVKQYNGEFTIKNDDNVFSANIMIPLQEKPVC